jgi:hypothetical protein
MTDTTAYELTTHNNNSGGWIGYTLVVVFETAALNLPGDSITDVRLTFRNPTSEGCDLAKVYVGHGASSGDAYDFAATPVQVLFGGSGTVSLGTSSPTTSDWTSFAYDKTSRFVISWYISSSVDTMIYRASVSNVSSYYRAGDEAATVNKSAGYGPLSGDNYLVGKIEVRTAGGATNTTDFFMLLR